MGDVDLYAGFGYSISRSLPTVTLSGDIEAEDVFTEEAWTDTIDMKITAVGKPTRTVKWHTQADGTRYKTVTVSWAEVTASGEMAGMPVDPDTVEGTHWADRTTIVRHAG